MDRNTLAFQERLAAVNTSASQGLLGNMKTLGAPSPHTNTAPDCAFRLYSSLDIQHDKMNKCYDALTTALSEATVHPESMDKTLSQKKPALDFSTKEHA